MLSSLFDPALALLNAEEDFEDEGHDCRLQSEEQRLDDEYAAERRIDNSQRPEADDPGITKRLVERVESLLANPSLLLDKNAVRDCDLPSRSAKLSAATLGEPAVLRPLSRHRTGVRPDICARQVRRPVARHAGSRHVRHRSWRQRSVSVARSAGPVRATTRRI